MVWISKYTKETTGNILSYTAINCQDSVEKNINTVRVADIEDFRDYVVGEKYLLDIIYIYSSNYIRGLYLRYKISDLQWRKMNYSSNVCICYQIIKYSILYSIDWVTCRPSSNDKVLLSKMCLLTKRRTINAKSRNFQVFYYSTNLFHNAKFVFL